MGKSLEVASWNTMLSIFQPPAPPPPFILTSPIVNFQNIFLFITTPPFIRYYRVFHGIWITFLLHHLPLSSPALWIMAMLTKDKFFKVKLISRHVSKNFPLESEMVMNYEINTLENTQSCGGKPVIEKKPTSSHVLFLHPLKTSEN